MTVSSIGPEPYSCVLFGPEAQNSDGSYLLEAGLVKCGQFYSLDGTCSIRNNLVKYVEREIGANNYTCFGHGAASTGTEYVVSVQNAVATTWYPYIDGTAYEGVQFAWNSIYEWGENTRLGGITCSGWSGNATFAQNATWPWQRYVQGSSTWKNVQSSYTLNDGPCWSFFGGPPGWFQIYH